MSNLKPRASGNPSAPVWLIADSCVPQDTGGIGTGYPWRHLHTILDSIGFHDYYLTYVSDKLKYKPFATKTEGKEKHLTYHKGRYLTNSGLKLEADHLDANIQEHRPEIIVPMGDIALWSIMGLESSAKWRGSQLFSSEYDANIIPTQSPLSLDKVWEWRVPMTVDFKRILKQVPRGRKPVPEYTNDIVWPNYLDSIKYLNKLLLHLSNYNTMIANDIETAAGSIMCMGFCYDILEAICIPFNSTERPIHYTDDQFVTICMLIRRVLTHPNAEIVGQNYNYDRTYIFNELLCWPEQIYDTMVAQHIMLPGTPKGLDYLSSLYCENYVYWKDESKEASEKNSEEIEYKYNCKDVRYTLEVAVNQKLLLSQIEKRHLYDEFSQILEPLQLLQLDGVCINLEERSRLSIELGEAKDRLQSEINLLADQELNPNSPKQCMEFFYERANCKPYINRRTKKPTLADKYLEQLGKRDTLLQPLTDRITEYRSFGVLKSNTVDAGLWSDERIHCSYNATGTPTFRLSSSKDPYRKGCNNQNVTERAAGVNLRRMFNPDPGYLWVSMDLDRADLQVVAKESNALKLLPALRAGDDVWTIEAAAFLDKPESAIEYMERHYMKERVHAINYGATPRTLAIQFNTTISEAANFQEKWFLRHPEIPQWQEQIEMEMMGGILTNVFGYAWTIFTQIDNRTLNAALAWKPQSTVAILCHKMMTILWKEFRRHRDIFRFTLQLHDELGYQIKESHLHKLLPEIKEMCEIPIPYEEPLIIPVGFKVGPNWGELEDYEL